MGTAIIGTQMRTLKASVVTELPDKGVSNKIYYVPNGTTGDNKYDEYIWIKDTEHPNGYFEKVGQKDIDLNIDNLPIKESVSDTDKIVVNDGGNNKGVELSKVKKYAIEGVATKEELKGYVPLMTIDHTGEKYAECNGVNYKESFIMLDGDTLYLRLDGLEVGWLTNHEFSICNGAITYSDGRYDDDVGLKMHAPIKLHPYYNDYLIVEGNEHNDMAFTTNGGTITVYSKDEINKKLSAKADTTKASTTSDGLMSKEDKAKLDSLAPKEQLFIDMWNSAYGTNGKYNTETGFYELNGLTDITYEQALAIYRVIGCETSNVYRPNVRTVLYSGCAGMTIATWKRFENCYNIEVVKHSDYVTYGNTTESMFDGCAKLRSILGIVNINNVTVYSYMFRRCVKLENFTFKGLNSNLTISDSPLITYNTLEYLINNALGNKVTTITVHPTTYAYLQGTTPPTEQVGGTTEQWQALVTAATNKKISFATTK